jgi:hypothetical protein
MLNGPRVAGVFETKFHAASHFSDVTGVAIKDIELRAQELTGHTLLLVDDYPQARLVPTVFH